MSQIYKRIQDDIKTAMKTRSTVVVNTLRLLVDLIQKKMLVSGAPKEITDDIVIDCIIKSIKQREESIEAYKKGNRDDLVQKETNELNILKGYQPTQISEEDIRLVVKDIIAKLSPISSIGLVMKAVMTELKGKADGALISSIVKQEVAK